MSNDDVETLAGEMANEATARLTDIEVASRMFTALLDCRAMFRRMTEDNMREAAASVEIALAKAKGLPRPAPGGGAADVFPTVKDAQTILDAMFVILSRCHSGEFRKGDREELMEWARRQLRLLGYDVVPMGMSHAVLRGRTAPESPRCGGTELVEADRPE